MKLEGDPGHMDFRPLGSAFYRSSTPAGVTLEVVTTTAVAVVIQGMGLLPDSEVSLLQPVQRARRLLTDDNPTNDRGACGHLRAFILQVDALEELLGAPPTWYLRQLALNLTTGLGCPKSAG